MAGKAKRLGKDILYIAIIVVLVDFLFLQIDNVLNDEPEELSCVETMAPNGASSMNCRRGE